MLHLLQPVHARIQLLPAGVGVLHHHIGQPVVGAAGVAHCTRGGGGVGWGGSCVGCLWAGRAAVLLAACCGQSCVGMVGCLGRAAVCHAACCRGGTVAGALLGALWRCSCPLPAPTREPTRTSRWLRPRPAASQGAAASQRQRGAAPPLQRAGGHPAARGGQHYQRDEQHGAARRDVPGGWGAAMQRLARCEVSAVLRSAAQHVAALPGGSRGRRQQRSLAAMRGGRGACFCLLQRPGSSAVRADLGRFVTCLPAAVFAAGHWRHGHPEAGDQGSSGAAAGAGGGRAAGACWGLMTTVPCCCLPLLLVLPSVAGCMSRSHRSFALLAGGPVRADRHRPAARRAAVWPAWHRCGGAAGGMEQQEPAPFASALQRAMLRLPCLFSGAGHCPR